MRITVTHDFDSPDVAINFLQLRAYCDTLFDAIKHGDAAHQAWLKEAIDSHLSGKPVPPPNITTVAVAGSSKPTRTTKKAAAPAETKSPPPLTSVDSTPVAAAPAAPITKEKAQAVLEDVFAAKGIEAARDLLKHFKVKRLQDLSADRFPEFIEKAKVVVAGGDTL